MDPLVLDIETVSAWDTLTDAQREKLTTLHAKARAKDPTLTDSAADACALQPATGRIVSIAVLNPILDAGEVLYDGTEHATSEPDDDRISWTTGTEEQLLRRFWKMVAGRQVVTFNGFTFDAPYLVARSLYLGIQPTQRIAPKWYDRDVHIDLREELSCFGHAKAYSLAFTCELYGIPSPKGELDGSMVGDAFWAGEIEKIAEYNLSDVRATAALFKRLGPALPRWSK